MKKKVKKRESYQLPGDQCRYTPDPGECVTNHVFCGLCKEECIVKRNRRGPRSSAQAMAGGSSSFDLFYCPHLEEDWHKQALALREQARKCPSKIIADIFEEEANLILRNKKTTKKWSSWWAH